MRRLRRSLTTRGLAFAGCGAVLLAAGILLGQHDLTRVGVLLLALTAIGLLLVSRHGLDLEVSRSAAPARVAIGERSLVTVRLRNAEDSVSPVLMVEESLDYALGDRPRFVLPSLRPGEAQEIQYTVRSHSRGVHHLGPLGVRVRDPFGLSLRARAVSGQGEVVVLPRVVPLPSGRALGSGIGSEGSVPHMVALHGEDDQTVREYRDGDDLRRIHWPATARTGEMMVRQEDRPAKRRAVVLLDASRSGHAGSGRHSSFEWCVTTVASVVAHLTELRYAVHLLTPDPGSDLGAHHDESLEGSLDRLARVDTDSDEGFRSVLHAASGLTSQGGLVVYVGGGLGDDDARTLAALRQPGSSGVAMVVDLEAFGARAARGSRAEPDRGRSGAVVSALGASGWSATSIGPGTTPGEAWSAVVGAQPAGVR